MESDEESEYIRDKKTTPDRSDQISLKEKESGGTRNALRGTSRGAGTGPEKNEKKTDERNENEQKTTKKTNNDEISQIKCTGTAAATLMMR